MARMMVNMAFYQHGLLKVEELHRMGIPFVVIESHEDNIKKFKEQYPKGPDCSQVSSQTQASSTNTQGSTAKP